MKGRGVRGVTVALAPVLLAGCSALIPDTSPGAFSDGPRPARPLITTTTVTTAAQPAPAGAAPALDNSELNSMAAALPPVGLGEGDLGPQVAALEKALDALGYDVGVLDDTFDQDTRHGVVAFQKVAGLERSGRATPDTVQRLVMAQPPAPLVSGGEPHRVEIDLERQVLLLYEENSLSRILAVSTGSGRRFCDGGWCRRAVTPTGKFQVYKRIQGWRKSELGRLFNPLYINGGIAIHGFPTVPAAPASHGCVRIPMTAAGWFPERVPDGTPVYVVKAPAPPAP